VCQHAIAGPRHLLLEADEGDVAGSLLRLIISEVSGHGAHQFFQAIEALDDFIHGEPCLLP
jgi:hypothetical protein